MHAPSPEPAAPVAPRRRRRVAVALVVVMALAGAGATLWHRHEQRAAVRAAALATFDLDAAMELAGTQVPPETESFYFFVLEPDRRGESDELAAKLVQAAGEHEFLGITGPDSDHNRAVLRAALARLEAPLAGLVIVYLGPAEHEAELTRLVQPTGAQFRFVAYGPEPETI